MKMRFIVIVLFVITLGTYQAAGQEDYATEAVSIVRQFVKVELRGGRLNPEGWRSAGNRFFLRPAPPPETKDIRIVSDKFFVKLDTFTTKADATVEASFASCYGTIDSQLRFKAPPERGQGGTMVVPDCWSSYRLVLSPWYWQQGAGNESKKPTGATPMRITDIQIGVRFQPATIMLDRSAAIDYLTQMREKTKDPALRRNATATLAVLNKLKD